MESDTTDSDASQQGEPAVTTPIRPVRSAATTPYSGGSNAVVPPTPAAQLLHDNEPPTTPLTPLSALDEDEERPLQSPPVSPSDVSEGRERARNNRLPFLPLPPANDDDPLFQFPAPGQEQYIRGTDLNIPTAATAFQHFLRNFKSLRHSQQDQQADNAESDSDSSMSDDDDDDESLDDLPPRYISRLQALLRQGSTSSAHPRSLDIDTMHIYYHNPACQRFYQQLVLYPAELIPLMDILVQRELERLAAGTEMVVPVIQVRPYNLKNISNLRCLDPVDMDSLVSIKGMIVRTSSVIPDLKRGFFSCVICGHSVESAVDRGRIVEPTRCPVCATKNSYSIQHNRGVYADKQLVRIQETPDKVPAGQTPASVMTFCFDDLVDSVQPGDKVEATGVLKAQPVRVHPKISKIKSVYKTYVDIIHFRKISGSENEQDKHDLASSNVGGNVNSSSRRSWTPQRIDEMHALSRDPDIYQKLTTSLAPSIWELDDVKRGVLCMLFGGNHVRVQQQTERSSGAKSPARKRRLSIPTAHDSSTDDDDDEEEDHDRRASISNGDSDRTVSLLKRGDINILLCGDPGTSKSQLLTYVHKLSHRGVYTSGKGSSAVGLTASIVRDPETRDLVLESGALVLSDQGICCIDEFDKMSDTTRSVLHEAMEQQTVSIAKAGIIATLHARTSVLASANPSDSRYNPNISVVENIKLPPTLLSRFDLIYLILDSPNVDHDRRLAQHLVGLYYETPNIVQPPIDQNLLKDYIQYARENIHPRISDAAAHFLTNSYLEMRNPGSMNGMGGGYANVGSHGTRTISATPRQLESLVRLSESLAKMRFSLVVEERDAREAVRLMHVATQAAATDPRTGRIDMDMIHTGRSALDRQHEEQIAQTLQELLRERRGSRMTVRDIERQLREITNATPPHDVVVEILRRLEDEGIVQWNAHAQTNYVQTGLAR